MTKQFVMKYLKYPLVEYIEKHHWKETIELCRNLIDDKITEENKIYLKRKLGDLVYLKEKGRSNEEYALNLILGWAVGDAMLEIFNDQLGLTTSLNSADKTREFLKTPKASSDFIIFHENQEYFVEIVSDYNGFWKRTLLCHLRDNKFLNVKAEDGIIFGNDYKNNRCIILKANSIVVILLLALLVIDFMLMGLPYGAWIYLNLVIILLPQILCLRLQITLLAAG